MFRVYIFSLNRWTGSESLATLRPLFRSIFFLFFEGFEIVGNPQTPFQVHIFLFCRKNVKKSILKSKFQRSKLRIFKGGPRIFFRGISHRIFWLFGPQRDRIFQTPHHFYKFTVPGWGFFKKKWTVTQPTANPPAEGPEPKAWSSESKPAARARGGHPLKWLFIFFYQTRNPSGCFEAIFFL